MGRVIRAYKMFSIYITETWFFSSTSSLDKMIIISVVVVVVVSFSL